MDREDMYEIIATGAFNKGLDAAHEEVEHHLLCILKDLDLEEEYLKEDGLEKYMRHWFASLMEGINELYK